MRVCRFGQFRPIEVFAAVAISGGVLTAVAPASAMADVAIAIHQDRVLQDRFQGLGYNIYAPDTDDDRYWTDVFAKRLREVNSHGFARYNSFGPDQYAPSRDVRTWNSTSMRRMVRTLQVLEDIDTDVYFRGTFNNNPDWLGSGYPIDGNPAMLADYADAVVEGLDHLVNVRGLSNLRYWNPTNELSARNPTGGDNWGYWGKNSGAQMPSYEAHVRAVHQRLAAAGLSIGVLNTDASVDAIIRPSLDYAVAHMDDVSEAWGVHDYPRSGTYWIRTPGGGWLNYPAENGDDWDETHIYDRALKRFQSYTQYHTAGTGKDFILGEFGGAGVQTNWPSGRLNTFKDIDQGGYGVFMAERVLAGLNSGFAGMMQWELVDDHNVYPSGWTAYREHGAWTEPGKGAEVRPFYYAYGLLTRYIRKDSTVFETTSSDGLVRTAAVRHNEDGTWTIIVVNRHDAAMPLDLAGLDPSLSGEFRRFVFDPAAPPETVNGDLPDWDVLVTVTGGTFSDVLPAGVLAVYTTDFDETAPDVVKGLSVSGDAGDKALLTWQASDAEDLAYYRIYRGDLEGFDRDAAVQIGSTIGTDFVVDGDGVFAVTAIDRYGNESALWASPIPEPAALTVMLAGTVALFTRGAGGRRRVVDADVRSHA